MEDAFDDAGALVPTRKSSLNARNIVQEHRKRKSSTLNELSVLTSGFDAVTVGGTHVQSSFTFHPISTILRAHLPLSWLSGVTTCGLAPANILKANITSVNKWDYHVLIARLASNRALFALERVENDIYVSYPLHSWVRPQWIEQAAYGAGPVIDLDVLLQHQHEPSHSRKPSTTSVSGTLEQHSVPPSPKVPTNRRGQLARLSILEAREKTEDLLNKANEVQREPASILQVELDQSQDVLTLSPVPADQSISATTTLPAVSQPLPTSAASTAANPAPICQSTDEVKQVDHLAPEHLRRQFLETLYLSRTSLAFYAKGPLSRARARARIPGASQTSQDLADFYRESILPPKKTDLKYKETIQAKIATLVRQNDDQAEQNTQSSRKNKRTKLGKDGLWPIESEYIERWWKSQEFVAGSSSNAEAFTTETKDLIFQLRMRETEMHILLILEILSLQAKDIPNQKISNTPTISEVKVESIEGADPNEAPKTGKVKKKADLKSELDLLVDRLCIWHSIGLESAGMMLNEKESSCSSSEKVRDRLRDFCKDVLIPFYGGKLSEVCQDLCAKMGGSEVPGRRTNSTSEKIARRVPGSAITTERGVSGKRDLQRVLSEEQSIRHGSPPSLLRAATVSMPIKREPSERPTSRGGVLQKSVSFSNREVDLVADARATAAKRRKLDLVAAQKRELDAAIETLKRPNRHIVAKNFMDDVERRILEEKASSSRTDTIQISATPRKNRVRAAQDEEYDLPSIPVQSWSQEQRIPSSTAKPRGLSQISHMSQSSTKKRAVLSAIHDTPSRGSASKFKTGLDINHAGLDGAVDGESSSTLVALTPSTSRLRTDQMDSTPMRMCKSLKTVLLTPMERSKVSIDEIFKDVPEIPERAGKMMDRVMGSKADAADVSLYESLGWNDDYDV